MAPILRPVAVAHRSSVQPVRQSRTRVTSYRESSDEDGSEYDEQDQTSYRVRRQRIRDRSDSSESFGRSRSPPMNGGSSKTKSRRVTRSSSTRNKRVLVNQKETKSLRKRSGKPDVQVDERMALSSPPWQTLPYHVLHEILATVPESNPRHLKWLLDVSCMCRSFFEAGVDVLYYSPLLYPRGRLTRLLNLLSQPQERLSTNYQNKIKRLDVNMSEFSTRKSDLSQFVSHTPQLRHVRLFFSDDRDSFQTVSLPDWETFFDILDTNNVRLHSWQWCFKINEISSLDSSEFTAFHMRPSFSTLRSLEWADTLSVYNLLDNEEAIKNIFGSMSVLPSLERLVFRNCCMHSPSDESPFLSAMQLNPNLRSLTLDHCHIDQPGLEIFLSIRGKGLRDLSMRHIPDVTMAFTSRLAHYCPNLVVFRMGFMSEEEPDSTLNESSSDKARASRTPSWPPTLQVLNLDRPGRWSMDDSVNIFNSIIQSTPDLRDLRVLKISASIDIPWRYRAAFRENWVHKLESVFLRSSSPPSTPYPPTGTPHFFSEKASSEPYVSQSRPTRHSSRIAEKQADGGNDQVTSHTSGVNNSADVTSAEDPIYVHGMCDVVEIRIDNLRPTGHIVTAEDFADSEISGDDDWDGDDEEVVDTYAW